jgi:long-chain fatty acid transport protein
MLHGQADFKTQLYRLATYFMTTKTKSDISGRNMTLWSKPNLLLVAMLAIAPLHVLGLGLRIPNQDASAIARGNAFAATADNPSAIYYNPAGITQLEGQHLQVGSLVYLGIYGDYKSPSGQEVDNDPEVLPVPNVYYTYSPKESPLSFGLGVYEPFGFSVKWPNDAPFRTAGTEGNLTYITINPVVALKVHRTFSIAAGPTFNYGDITLKRGLLPSAGIIPGDQFKFDGNNWAYGYTLGALWHPVEKWSFGLSYRSESCMKFEGNASISPAYLAPPPLPPSSSASTELKFPQIIIGGVSYRPNANWNIEFNVDWADWSSVNNLKIAPYADEKLDWNSSFMYEFGVTRSFENGYYASVGFFYSEASTSGSYFTPLVPDTDLYIGSFGGGHKGEQWDWALAVQIIAGDWRSVENQSNPSVDGKYKLFTPTISFSVGYHF